MIDTTTNKPINVLYFAALADELECKSETIQRPESVSNVEQLKQHLSQRGGKWAALDNSDLCCAVNQTISKSTCAVSAGDEIAFFPPVTGG